MGFTHRNALCVAFIRLRCYIYVLNYKLTLAKLQNKAASLHKDTINWNVDKLKNSNESDNIYVIISVVIKSHE